MIDVDGRWEYFEKLKVSVGIPDSFSGTFPAFMRHKKSLQFKFRILIEARLLIGTKSAFPGFYRQVGAFQVPEPFQLKNAKQKFSTLLRVGTLLYRYFSYHLPIPAIALWLFCMLL